jgi:hypothetical protein
MSVSDVTDFPEPDSPTIPSVFPEYSENEILFTAVNSSFPFLKETFKSFTFKTSIDLISMPKLIIYWLWYKARAAADWLPLLALYLIQG